MFHFWHISRSHGWYPKNLKETGQAHQQQRHRLFALLQIYYTINPQLRCHLCIDNQTMLSLCYSNKLFSLLTNNLPILKQPYGVCLHVHICASQKSKTVGCVALFAQPDGSIYFVSVCIFTPVQRGQCLVASSLTPSHCSPITR